VPIPLQQEYAETFGHTASAEELIAFSRQHLAEYKCPQQILFLPVLPKGATGKVQRRALKDLRREAAAS
jgi:acyl-coenzyme A synthetase/AMP-(fatty) acid ligase